MESTDDAAEIDGGGIENGGAADTHSQNGFSDKHAISNGHSESANDETGSDGENKGPDLTREKDDIRALLCRDFDATDNNRLSYVLVEPPCEAFSPHIQGTLPTSHDCRKSRLLVSDCSPSFSSS